MSGTRVLSGAGDTPLFGIYEVSGSGDNQKLFGAECVAMTRTQNVHLLCAPNFAISCGGTAESWPTTHRSGEGPHSTS